MATPNTVQKELLKPASSCLDAYLSVFSDVSKRSAARLSILEQCSSIIGGFNLKRYRRITKWDAAVPDDLDTAKIITSAIQKIPISPALTLSILATEDLSTHTKKTTGAYYTDFRLARALAETFATAEQPTGEICPRIIDLAAGSGILLVALAIVLGRKRPIADVISESIYGVDLSEMAIRQENAIEGKPLTYCTACGEDSKEWGIYNLDGGRTFWLASSVEEARKDAVEWYGVIEDSFPSAKEVPDAQLDVLTLPVICQNTRTVQDKTFRVILAEKIKNNPESELFADNYGD